MSEKEKIILQYLALAKRRSYIITKSGKSWKSGYAKELEEIDKELPILRAKIYN